MGCWPVCQPVACVGLDLQICNLVPAAQAAGHSKAELSRTGCLAGQAGCSFWVHTSEPELHFSVDGTSSTQYSTATPAMPCSCKAARAEGLVDDEAHLCLVYQRRCSRCSTPRQSDPAPHCLSQVAAAQPVRRCSLAHLARQRLACRRSAACAAWPAAARARRCPGGAWRSARHPCSRAPPAARRPLLLGNQPAPARQGSGLVRWLRQASPEWLPRQLDAFGSALRPGCHPRDTPHHKLQCCLPHPATPTARRGTIVQPSSRPRHTRRTCTTRSCGKGASCSRRTRTTSSTRRARRAAEAA